MSRKIALVIGNSEYDDAGLARLITPSEDVGDLAALLRSPDVGSFDEVIALVNESAATLRRSIAKLFAQKAPDDLVLLYFSGHGVLDDQGHLYLAVKDTERDLLSGTAIPANFITGEMDRSRSRRQVLMLDCCHSGAFARGSKGAIGASVGTAAVFEGTGYGRVVLTATDATQYAWEGDRVIGQADNSVFTHFMVQGLQTGEADQDHDGRITLDELYDYVYAQVVAKTPKQTPGKWSYRQQGDMVIAKNPRPIAPVNPLPHELIESISDSRPWVREGAVGELEALLDSARRPIAAAALAALQQLAADDSRKVAARAQANLSAFFEKANRAQKPAEQPPVEPTRSAQPADQERMAEPKAEAKRAMAVEPILSTSAAAATQVSAGAAAPSSVALRRTSIVAGGWIVGWASGIFLASVIDSNLVSFLSLIAGWSIAGLITGLILRRSTPSIQIYHIFILIVVWALLPLVGLIMQGSGSGGSYQTSLALIASVAFTWLINSWFVLQLPPTSMWWQALVVGAAGAIGWVSGGTEQWNFVALRLSGSGWSLPFIIQDSGIRAVGLLSNVILSGLIGGSVLAIVYGLTQKQASPAPAPIGRAAPLETRRSTVPATVGQSLTNQQRAALLASVIISIGWFAAWLAGILIGSLWTDTSSGAISLALSWMSTGVITGLVLKKAIHSAWWPLVSLGLGWPLCLVLSFYLNAPGLIVLAVAVTWLINSLTAMLVVRNRLWLIAALTTAAASIVWIILGNPWDVAALKLFGANYHAAWATFFAGEHYGAVDLLLIPAVTAAVAGSILTFLLYRRAEATEQV